MELVLIAFVGTLFLMAAELRDFIRRERPLSITAGTGSAPSRLGTPAPAKSQSRAKEYFYDAAA